MHPLVSSIVRREKRAAARAFTIIENDAEGKRDLLQGLYPYAGRAHIVGFTGSPGAGKSTLVDRVIRLLREAGLQVGVLAVDPSSPFSGGALLGDRIRMSAHSDDDGVFIRSMGSRGSVGGLAKTSRDMIYVFEAYGCDVVLVETVGVGQSELDVMSVADTIGLVLTPGTGDQIQTAKAGIMEIADIFIVNKSDIPGADVLKREVEQMLHERQWARDNWAIPVVLTSASRGEGIPGLWEAMQAHKDHQRQHGWWLKRRQKRHRQETLQLVLDACQSHLLQLAETDITWKKVLEEDLQTDPYASAQVLMKSLPWLSM